MPLSRKILTLLALFLTALAAHAQAYTSIVVIGDSLSDSGNDAAVSAALYTAAAQLPGPATGYTNGRFTDGTDTSPAARSYTGVWVEQLAALLAAKPTIKNSLAGGTNYAYGFAFTGAGTSVLSYGPANAFSFNVNNMELQLSTYLATNPTITNKTLFVIWGGANDLLNATATTATQVVTQAVTNEATIIQGLISAGATDFLIVNLPPLGLTPRLNGSATTSVPANQLAASFDSALATAVAAIPAANPTKTLHLFQLDTYTLFNTIIGPPLYTGFANVTAMSQGNATINPDTYLFWDSIHPTTYGHSLLAAAALTAIGTPITTTTKVTSSNLAANLGSSVTLTASVTSATGTPTGAVAFYDGTTALGGGYAIGSGTTATATVTTSALAAGSHTITAVFAGVNGYTSSTSAAITEVVTAPALNASFAASSIAVASGGIGTATLNLNAVGGYSGTATLACGTPLPAHFSCSISPTSVTFPGSTTSAIITVNTAAATALLQRPSLFGGTNPEILAALLFFPGLGGLALGARRRIKPRLLGLIAVLTLGGMLGLAGCGSNAPNNNAPAGSYTVPITVTTGTSAVTLNLSVVVQ